MWVSSAKPAILLIASVPASALEIVRKQITLQLYRIPSFILYTYNVFLLSVSYKIVLYESFTEKDVDLVNFSNKEVEKKTTTKLGKEKNITTYLWQDYS